MRQREEVTLPVSAYGQTKEDALAKAVYSAVEQTFVTFVSADASLLRAAAARGETMPRRRRSLCAYKILWVAPLAQQRIMVVMQATVSIKTLVAYAKSKGSPCEFAGATFGYYRRRFELNKRNEEKVLMDLCVCLKELSHTLYDYDLIVKEPLQDEQDSRYVVTKLRVIYKANDTTERFGALLRLLFSELSMSEKQAEKYVKMGFVVYRYQFCEVLPTGCMDRLLRLLCHPFRVLAGRHPLPPSKQTQKFSYHYCYPVSFNNELARIFTASYFYFHITDNNGGIINVTDALDGQSLMLGDTSGLRRLPDEYLVSNQATHWMESDGSNVTRFYYHYKKGRTVCFSKYLLVRLPVEVARGISHISIVPDQDIHFDMPLSDYYIDDGSHWNVVASYCCQDS